MRIVRTAAFAIFAAVNLLAFSQAGWSQTTPPSSPLPSAQPPVVNGPVGQANQGTASGSSTLTASQPTTDQAQSAPAVPDYVRYRFFFAHLANLDAAAAREEEKGSKDADKWRTHEQRAAKLTEEEGRLLKQVSDRCNQALKDEDAKIQSAIQAFQDQHPNGLARTAPKPPEWAQLDAERKQIIESHIEQLRSLLGSDSFQKLDTYIQSNFKIVVVNPSETPASITPAKLIGDPQ